MRVKVLRINDSAIRVQDFSGYANYRFSSAPSVVSASASSVASASAVVVSPPSLTLLGNADFLAVASFAGIFVDHDEDGHRDTYRFLQQNAHKWVIEARPFDVELAYDNEQFDPEIHRDKRVYIQNRGATYCRRIT